MFGSDWPVAVQAATYQTVYETRERCLCATRRDWNGGRVRGQRVRFYGLGG